jgi:alpha-tubulin suppressor-like RCC1 family protein
LRSYAVADTGELWAWGVSTNPYPLGHGEDEDCPLPKPIESLRGIKVDAVAGCRAHTLAVADNGCAYSWSNRGFAWSGALGFVPVDEVAENKLLSRQHIPGLRVACGGLG